MAEHESVTVRLSEKPPVPDFKDILDRAEKGDRSALPQIRDIVKRFPYVVDELGDLTRIAHAALRSRLYTDSLLVETSLEEAETEMVEKIAGPEPSVLEKLLADQIVLCWQHVRYLEIQYGKARSYRLQEGEYYERCLDRAQARYLKAIKSLAQIRNLECPALQVNIASHGGRQINLGGSAAHRGS